MFDAAIAASISDTDASRASVPAATERSDANALVRPASAQEALAESGPPVLNGPTSLTMAEDGVFAFSGANAVSLSGPPDAVWAIDVWSAAGSPEVVAAGSAVLEPYPDGRGFELSGTLEDINATLASLTFTPHADFHGGTDIQWWGYQDGNFATIGSQHVEVSPVVDVRNDVIHVTPGATFDFDVMAGTGGATADSFEDPGADVWDVSALAQPGAGQIEWEWSGSEIRFTADPGFTGRTSFTYQVFTSTFPSGGGYNSETGTVTLIANDFPENAAPDAVSTPEDTPFDFTGANAISVDDPEGDIASVQLTVAHGTLSVPDGATIIAGANGGATLTLGGTMAQINAALADLRYTPDADYNGPDSLSIVTSDEAGAIPAQTVDITVTPVDDAFRLEAPAAVSTDEETVLVFADGDALSIVDPDSDILAVDVWIVSGFLDVTPAGAAEVTRTPDQRGMLITGSLADINATLATLTYTPAPDYHGTSHIAVYANLSSGSWIQLGTIAVVVEPAPDVRDDTIRVNPGGTVVFDVMTGSGGATADTFEDGGAFVVQLGPLADPGAGSIEWEMFTSQIRFTADADFTGSTTFTYEVHTSLFPSGGGANAETGTVTIVMNDKPVNTAPDAVSTPEDRAFSFTEANALSVSDTDEITSVRLAVTHGTLSVAAGATITAGANGSGTLTLGGTRAAINAALASLQYTPTADFNGTASLSIRTTDALGLAATKTVDIAVTAVADITPDHLTTDEGVAVTADLLAGTNDATADSFEGSAAITQVTQGAHGTVTRNGNLVTYTPNAGYSGNDTFTYTVTSGGVTETATVTVRVDPVDSDPGENDAPQGTLPSAALTAIEDTSFALTGVRVADLDGDLLTATLSVSHGQLDVGADGNGVSGSGTDHLVITGTAAEINARLANLVYRPDTDYNGADSLLMTTSDGQAQDLDFAAIDIDSVVDIVADAVTTDKGMAITVDPIAGGNGAIADNFEASPIVSAVSQGAHGSVTIDAAGTVTYTPNAGYYGPDSFTYTVLSGGVTETAVVTVDVRDTPVSGNPPVGGDDDTEEPGDDGDPDGSEGGGGSDQVDPRETYVPNRVETWTVPIVLNASVIASEGSLFVEPAVRDSQVEALMLEMRVSTASQPEQGSPLFELFAPSGQEATVTEGPPAEQRPAEPRDTKATGESIEEALATESTEPAAEPVRGDGPVVAHPKAHRAAASFSAQLRRDSESLRTAGERRVLLAARASGPAR